jgi:hypothetical protein
MIKGGTMTIKELRTAMKGLKPNTQVYLCGTTGSISGTKISLHSSDLRRPNENHTRNPDRAGAVRDARLLQPQVRPILRSGGCR